MILEKCIVEVWWVGKKTCTHECGLYEQVEYMYRNAANSQYSYTIWF